MHGDVGGAGGKARLAKATRGFQKRTKGRFATAWTDSGSSSRRTDVQWQIYRSYVIPATTLARPAMKEARLQRVDIHARHLLDQAWSNRARFPKPVDCRHGAIAGCRIEQHGADGLFDVTDEVVDRRHRQLGDGYMERGRVLQSVYCGRSAQRHRGHKRTMPALLA
jgi:hypothetical protein